jgi:hypothetical protein
MRAKQPRLPQVLATNRAFRRLRADVTLRRNEKGPVWRPTNGLAGVGFALIRTLASATHGLSSDRSIAHRVELRGLGSQRARAHDWAETGIECRKSTREIVADPAVEIVPVDRLKCGIEILERP